ncbi:MAG: TrkA C-terminal domain-containing protein [Bacillota bacterium]|nr:TrkA C-terminal domain-containing protein [Bacillota bacterium]MDW7685304.1 TrkA C-terminal domain-containing protein [Bacillota bacterium]
MLIKEADLPGVGKKYTVNSAEGQTFVIIIHHSGRREIYLMDGPDEDEPLYTLEMSDEEARRVGAILLGADYQPVSSEKMEIVMKKLFIEWVKITEDSQLANQAIKDSRIKETTGATIIGIQRGEEMIVSPKADELLLPDDLLMVVGKREQLRALEPLCKDQGLCKE